MQLQKNVQFFADFSPLCSTKVHTNLSHQKRAPTTFNTNPDIEITMNDQNHGIEQRPVSRNGFFDTSTNYKRSGKIIIIGVKLDPVLAFLY